MKAFSKAAFSGVLLGALLTACEAHYFSIQLIDSSAFPLWYALPICLGFSACFALLSALSTRLRKILLLCVLAAALAFALIFTNAAQSMHEAVSRFIHAATNAALGYGALSKQHYLTASILASGALNLFHFMTIVSKPKLSSASIFTSVIFMVVLWQNNHQITLMLALFYLALAALFLMRLFFLRYTEAIPLKKGRRPWLSALLFSLCISLLIAFSASLLAINRTSPLSWIDELKWFKKETPEPRAYIARADTQQRLRSLSNAFYQDVSPVLSVTSAHLLHLRAQTFDTYDGSAWFQSQTLTQSLDDLLAAARMKQHFFDAHAVPYETAQIQIVFTALSEVLYLPSDTVNIIIPEALNVTAGSDTGLRSSNQIAAGTSYLADALHYNLSDPKVQALLRTLGHSSLEAHDHFLQLPEELPERVKQLALDLTQAEDSDYEKVKRIERFLSQSYTYSLTPPEKPSKQDYVDYFLFDSQEGFCTAYASSMVMLVRSIGIPCRYAVGYVLTPDAVDMGDLPIPDGYASSLAYRDGIVQTFALGKKHSHAWVEVWFDSLGWVSFDPTSGFAILYDGSDAMDTLDFSVPIPHTDEKAPESIAPQLLTGGLIAALLLIFTLLLLHQYHRLRYRCAKPNARVFILYGKLLTLYAALGTRKAHSETMRAFALRVTQCREAFWSVTLLAERLSYTQNKSISAEDLLLLQTLYDEISDTLIKSARPLKGFLLRIRATL